MLRVYCPNIYTVAHTLISGMGELGQTYLRMCLRNLWMVPYDLATTGALRIHIYSWQIVWAIFPGNNTGNIQQFFPGSLGKRFLRGSIAGSTVSRSASRHYIFWISLKNCMNCTWLVYHQTQSDPTPLIQQSGLLEIRQETMFCWSVYTLRTARAELARQFSIYTWNFYCVANPV